MEQERTQRWQQLTAQIEHDYRHLPATEKRWIAEQLEQIAELQEQLQQLFSLAGGDAACRSCDGECCAKGHNHMTLANLLAFLQRGEQPPPADFAQTCPFLSGSGCLLAPAERPYNCISFICDKIEDNMSAPQLESFYRLEKSLRTVYLEFARRYRGAAMTGLLLQAQRLDGESFFSSPC